MRPKIFLLCLICLALAMSASAEELTPWPVYNGTRQIENGGCVEINSTVDVSSIGWGIQKIIYIDRYTSDFSVNGYDATFSLRMPYSAKALKYYYIDPFIFGNRTGYWYQNYAHNNTEPAGNQRMFYVNATCPAKPVDEPAPVNITVEQTDKTVPDLLQGLPAKKESNILLARGDRTTVDAGSPLHWWMFGYGPDDIIRDREVINPEGTLTIKPDDMQGLATGNYQMVLVRAGSNKIYEEYYNPEYKPYRFANRTYPVIESPFRSVEPADIEGLQPQQVKEILVKSVSSSIDDTATEWTVQYQEPEIQIKRIDAIESRQTNSTWYNVRGYTNLAEGTLLTVTIDKSTLNDVTREIREFSTTVTGTNDAGEWRQFNALIPADYKNIFPGMHDVTVAAGGRASQTVQVYIYKELPAHYVPPQYIEYTGVSPYVTPQIIEKIVTVEVPGPERVREVHIAPTEAELQQAREKADWEVVQSVLTSIVVLLGFLGLAWWTWSAYRRTAAV